MRRQPFSIVLIGPHALLREGLTHILCGAHFGVVASAACLSDVPPNAFQRDDRIFLIIESNGDVDIALPQIKLFKEPASKRAGGGGR
jgi:two-component system, NarL family, nitrate/nitrite response regulator NarL